MESGIVRLFRFQCYKLMKSQVINYKKQSCFIFIIRIIAWQTFEPKKERKISYIGIPKISIYLFKHFYLFHFNSTQFADFASLKYKYR